MTQIGWLAVDAVPLALSSGWSTEWFSFVSTWPLFATCRVLRRGWRFAWRTAALRRCTRG